VEQNLAIRSFGIHFHKILEPNPSEERGIREEGLEFVRGGQNVCGENLGKVINLEYGFFES